ncbi:hypothetical protein TNIN_129801 [Trichonephila inaurata madagascariensis]|uniref:Uncharacterized protein n=1 Tax=Trichonephila inaurata madagascariensis TaxID=2747483 RepID=A0A8X6M8Q5_9ARAC|nr:hypothetical protein TNIN_129801 [Trichonephila inaurata madagascariensis]
MRDNLLRHFKWSKFLRYLDDIVMFRKIKAKLKDKGFCSAEVIFYSLRLPGHFHSVIAASLNEPFTSNPLGFNSSEQHKKNEKR